jgi:membrane-bound serine protease (ClpP class)
MVTTVIGTAFAGLCLLFLEMFLPGLIAGIIGGILLFAAVVLAYTNLGIEAGNYTLLCSALATAGLWWWWASRFQQTRFGRSMTLEAAVRGHAPDPALASFAGQAGSAATPLRPSGTVLIAGRRVDAMTDGEFLDPGTPIQVIRVHGMGLLVRKA